MAYEWLKCGLCGFTRENKMEWITMDEYLQGREKDNPLSDEQKINAAETIKRTNLLLDKFSQKRHVNSGYRPAALNAAIGGAKGSKHMSCQAIDLEDNDGKLKDFIIMNLELCQKIGLWFENPSWTHTEDGEGSWMHMQTCPPASGKRFFIPNSNAPLNSKIWSGNYDHKYDSKS